jgi:ATP-dependent DNA ligase
LVEHIEASDGGTVFEHACQLVEGIVSKRRDAPYRHG